MGHTGPLPERKTVFSDCRKYRYTLWRQWTNDPAAPFAMFIGLNPSTADEKQDDPTIRRCIGFSKRWGFGALLMTNLFAWRDTKPENMKRVLDPVGDQNDYWLTHYAAEAGIIIAAWGKDGAHVHRQKRVIINLSGMPVMCLKINNDGTPKHPLYVAGDTTPIPFK